MYRLPAFAEDDRAGLEALIAAHPLGLLLTAGPAGLMANPIPFTLAGPPEARVLRGHLARANPQGAELAAAPEVLVVFQPGDAYVSPSWYPSKAAHGRVVPTWNFAMVQARGRARLCPEAPFLRAQIEVLTAQMEHPRPAPWAVDDAPEDCIAAQMRAIVGVEIDIHSIEGKLKLSQNRGQPDREGVRAGMMAEGVPLARLMPDPNP